MYSIPVWRGPAGGLEPEDRVRVDAAIETAETINARIGEATEAAEIATEAAQQTDADAQATEAGRQQAVQAAGDAAAARAAAELERLLAEQQRQAAEAAAVAAAQSAQFYDTIAAGRAAVADGEQFGVRAGGADGLTRPTIYRRDSASTQTLIVELVPAADVDAIAGRIGGTASDHLWTLVDSAGQTVSFLSAGGDFYLPKLGAKPVQQQLSETAAAAAIGAAAGESVQRLDAPSLTRMTDAEGKVFALIDEAGNLYTSRLGHRSVQDHILSLRDRMDNQPGGSVADILKRRRVYDAVYDFAVPNDGITNATPSIQAAVNFLSAQTFSLGPSVLYFREGVYKLDSPVTPKNNVTIIMAGWGKSRFMPTGTASAFQGFYQTSNPLTRANFIDVEIDGSNQTYTGAYVGAKGMYFQRWQDCQFLRCYIHDTWATGLGIDFSGGGGSWVMDGRYEGCGRGSVIGNPGSSGIGIGTGVWQNEPLIIANNICRNNKNFGIFLERQHDEVHQYVARQNIITGNICGGNGWGIGEVGAGGTVIVGNQCQDSVRHGIYLYGGTISGPYEGPHTGIESMISENVCTDNLQDGLCYDGTRNKATTIKGFYTNHNQLNRNGGVGMRYIGKVGQEMVDFSLRNDEVKGNGAGGIALTQGAFKAFDIIGTRLIDNTGIALRIDAALTDSRLHGLTARSTLTTALQTTALAGSGTLTNVDISECVQTGHATPVALTGATTNVTLGRNPGFVF